ncbi:hypothetical protein JD844_012959 [Phrynosoma platyrhinos]|uniref:Uncharacterized protein n=1 Tax=Phrynosoma platyrhinos TaxID=52577 RepID=A0ABQ7TK92_PHRPL|nr:hypothetical protein JD844_012959 [Phrynosoma platyrhinos]
MSIYPITQSRNTYGHSSPFEGASAPPYELMEKMSADEKKSTEDSGHSLSASEQDIKEAFLQYAASLAQDILPPEEEEKMVPPDRWWLVGREFPRCYSGNCRTARIAKDVVQLGANLVRALASCLSCRSNGWLKCYRCSGNGVLLFHTELTITWKNNILEHLADKDSSLPIYLLQEATGEEILCDENFSKQTIELVPLTKAEYEWKGKLYSFYVFGKENKVYIKDYPSKCCCSLM